MYAVVQIGSRILRSACGTKRSVPPRFCACTNGARAVAATATDPARKARRLSWGMGDPPRECPILARCPRERQPGGAGGIVTRMTKRERVLAAIARRAV